MPTSATEPPLAELPGRLLRSIARLVIVLVPEYLIVVFLLGLFGEPLGRVLGNGGAAAVLIAAVVGTLLLLPTGGKIPILLGCSAPCSWSYPPSACRRP